jgi:hypothetical protein
MAAPAQVARRPPPHADSKILRISTPWQEDQVGRFFGVSQKRLARHAHLRAHGQTAGEVGDLARARGDGKVRREFWTK